MPEKDWVDLHVCNCMDELKDRCSLEDLQNKFGTKQLSVLVECCKQMQRYAEENERRKDMEMVYIYLSKFIELFVFMSRTRKSDLGFLKKMFSTEVKKGMDRLQELTENLERRYAKKLEDRGDNINKILPKSKSSSDDVTDDIQEKRLKKSEKETSKTDREMTTTGSITSIDLMNHAKMGKTIAIFDVRSAEWYQNSRINLNGVEIINIPNETIPSKIGQILESDASASDIWKRRKKFDLVVIVENALDSKSLESSVAGKLQKSLREYDYPGQYNCLKCLEGGFTEWHHMYPTFCTKSSTSFDFAKFIKNDRDGTTLSLHQIKYPSWDEVASVHKTIKSPSTNDTTTPTIADNTVQPPSASLASKQIPTINRQIKPTKSIQKLPSEPTNQNGHAVEEEPISDETMDKENAVPESEESPKPTKSTNLIVDRSTKPVKKEEVDKGQIKKAIQQSPNDQWSSSRGTTFEPLKTDSSSSSSSMKRSSSFPNLSKIDDEVCSPSPFPGTPPKYDRAAKPSMTSSTPFKPHEAGIHVSNITPGLTGLKNLGNTCYMNSIVQCLSNTDQLRKQMCTFDPQSAARLRHGGSSTSIVLEMDKVVRKLWAGKHKNFPCDELKNVVGKLKTSFRGYEQQDSHEFLTILLDWLHEELNKPDEARELLGADEATGERAWGEFRRRNNSIVADLFYGQLKSTVTCQSCAKSSVTFEPFSNLSLPLPANQMLRQDQCTLEECLELYLSKESISGWNCPNCKTARAATKKIDISRLPPILVIHLKRFTSNGARKKQTQVDFPVERLEMVPFTVPGSEQRNRSYQLYAVSNHYGTMESGHYTAYCLNPDLKRWYEFNDTEVIEVQENNVHTCAAYILFYKAIGR